MILNIFKFLYTPAIYSKRRAQGHTPTPLGGRKEGIRDGKTKQEEAREEREERGLLLGEDGVLKRRKVMEEDRQRDNILMECNVMCSRGLKGFFCKALIVRMFRHIYI